MTTDPFRKVNLRAFVIAVLMLLGIGFVVWQSPRFSYAGHAPFATPIGRAWLTVALGLLWLFGWGIAVLTRRIARVRITWDCAPVAPPPAAADDNRSLMRARMRMDDLFRSALRLLRKDGPLWRLGRHSLYRLPWYLLLGGEGCGKTALLSSSRLKFSQQEEQDVPRPDDPCRFWLGDQAVLLEAGGPLAFPGSQADTAYPLWRRMLKLLRRARPRCPLNGVVVAVSVMEVLAGEQELAARAHGIRGRLREMQRLFGVQFPVYVVVTHCDRLPGFEAFFQHLDRGAADQAWGVTFAGSAVPSDDAPLTAFPAEFAALVQRLHERVVHLVAAGGDSARAGKIYGFPAQFEALGEPLAALLADVFGRSPYAPVTWLRGVYFTSAAQDDEGPACRASALAAAAHGEARPGCRSLPNPHGYFIARLLRDVVFREHALAGRPLAFARRHGVLRYLGPALVVALVAAAGGAMHRSYRLNQSLIAATDRDTMRLASLAAEAGVQGDLADPADRADPVAILALLDMAHKPVVPAEQSILSAWLMKWVGLYQGDALGAAAQSAYRALLRQSLLPFVQDRARQAMTDSASDYGERFRALRAYLMMSDRAHYDSDAVLAWMAEDLRQLALTEAQRTGMLAHARALFDMSSRPPARADAALVARVRADLAAEPLPDRSYETLMAELRAAAPGALSVARLGGIDAPLVLRRISGRSLSEGVPAIYTLDGYRRYLTLRDTLVAAACRDRWVLGAAGVALPGAARLRAELDNDYFSHYIAAWDSLLDDVRARQIGSDAQGSAADMHLLSAADSPLLRFLQGAAEQTTLGGIQDPAAAAGRERSVAVADTSEVRKTGSMPHTTAVDRHFDALHQLFLQRDGGTAPFTDIQEKLGAAAVFLDAVDAARQRGLPPPPPDALAALQASAEGQPVPVGDILRDLASDGRILASDDMRRRLGEAWRANVVPFCHAASDGRYPISALSSQDMTQDDFNRLLGPGGLIDTFFQTNLLPYVDMTAHPWRWRPAASKLRFSRAALQAFEDAATIRQAFFPDGQKTMAVRFQLLPLSLDPYFTRFALTVGEQTLEYAHGPARPLSFVWPGGSGVSSARIDYEPTDADGRSGESVAGPWALFRLIDRGTLEKVRADRFILRFSLSGKPVALELDAGSVINPFALAALHRFRCMNELDGAGPAAARPGQG